MGGGETARDGAPAAFQQPALSVRGFARNYGETVAVADLSFEVGAGEILGLVGPNGAGKTTTLRSIAGVLPMQAGTVEVAGHDIARAEVAAKQALAWVPDEPRPFDVLTVEEHLEFTAALYGLGEWRGRADELIERFELTEKRGVVGAELSRGMRQKLACCCAWLSRPQVLLMDEPLSGLDPRGIRAAKRAIAELAASGTAVVLSSHLLDLIEELAGRLLILDRGRGLFLGSLREARERVTDGAHASLEEVFLSITGEGSAPSASTDGGLDGAGE
ncbi:MAG: ABC transporter ATP-binding protein [Planctomycetota bacterium]|jgi:ABC-2 type transport system ATP-binding protein|nr:ABC transporter ATP-binding protein [Planctomycetota bacterium]MDP6763536.1 ABC transporter ATP-binding protein [Planctomycetota bacterium]MDP6988145.1 ABC transporter ATP-binding protein [Planctomycetota bacterium]